MLVNTYFLKAQGSRLKAQGSRLKAQGSRLNLKHCNTCNALNIAMQ